MSVLQALAQAQRPLNLADIARAAGMGRSGAQRFVFTLKALGYLEQNPDNKQYVLSSKMLAFAHAYASTDAVQRLAAPVLESLREACGETVNLTLLSGNEVVYVLRYPSRHAVSVNLQIGSRLPAYCTAPGRALLAWLPPETAKAIIDASDRRQHTPNTETDPERLMAKLERVRERGYSVNDQERFVGDVSIAAAVRGRSGRPVAAINIAVPYPRWTIASLESEWAEALMQAAENVSRSLGFMPAAVEQQ